MLYMLASGMVTGPSAFNGKHYCDSLSLYPGLIPLFRGTAGVPANAVKHATSERGHLLPCIATFDLSELSGPAELMLNDGKKKGFALPPKRKTKNELALLIQAPLPLNLILSIHFRSAEDKTVFESAAKNVSNVDLSPWRTEVTESLFSQNTDSPWPPQQAQVPSQDGSHDRLPAFSQALGGILAMLYQVVNHSDLGLATYRLATGSSTDSDHELVQNDPVLKDLPIWLKGDVDQIEDVPSALFWGCLQSIIDAKMQGESSRAVDVVLDYLDNQRDTFDTEEINSRLQTLISDMRACFGLGGETVSELFKRHKKPVARSLLIFCLRESCKDLLEFSHPELTEEDYLLSSILFGARDTWLGLDGDFRSPIIGDYVTHSMAELEQRKWQSKVSIGPGPKRPKPLRELFPSTTEKFDQHQADAALYLTRQLQWNDCIQTRITPAEERDPKNHEQDGSSIVLPGEWSAEPEVIPERFLEQLENCPTIPHETEIELRTKLDTGNRSTCE